MLSFSEQKLMQLVVRGVKDTEIAHSLGLSTSEVRLRINELLKRLGLTERIELVFYAASQASRAGIKKRPAA